MSENVSKRDFLFENRVALMRIVIYCYIIVDLILLAVLFSPEVDIIKFLVLLPLIVVVNHYGINSVIQWKRGLDLIEKFNL